MTASIWYKDFSSVTVAAEPRKNVAQILPSFTDNPEKKLLTSISNTLLLFLCMTSMQSDKLW